MYACPPPCNCADLKCREALRRPAKRNLTMLGRVSAEGVVRARCSDRIGASTNAWEHLETQVMRKTFAGAALFTLAVMRAHAAGGDLLDAVEYYLPNLDHYFVT